LTKLVVFLYTLSMRMLTKLTKMQLRITKSMISTLKTFLSTTLSMNLVTLRLIRSLGGSNAKILVYITTTSIAKILES
jgi:hypothetical protein